MNTRFVDKTRFVDGFLGHEKSTNRVREGFQKTKCIIYFLTSWHFLWGGTLPCLTSFIGNVNNTSSDSSPPRTEIFSLLLFNRQTDHTLNLILHLKYYFVSYNEHRNSKKKLNGENISKLYSEIDECNFSQLNIVNNCVMTFLDDLRFMNFLQSKF